MYVDRFRGTVETRCHNMEYSRGEHPKHRGHYFEFSNFRIARRIFHASHSAGGPQMSRDCRYLGSFSESRRGPNKIKGRTNIPNMCAQIRLAVSLLISGLLLGDIR